MCKRKGYHFRQNLQCYNICVMSKGFFFCKNPIFFFPQSRFFYTYLTSKWPSCLVIFLKPYTLFQQCHFSLPKGGDFDLINGRGGGPSTQPQKRRQFLAPFYGQNSAIFVDFWSLGNIQLSRYLLLFTDARAGKEIPGGSTYLLYMVLRHFFYYMLKIINIIYLKSFIEGLIPLLVQQKLILIFFS